MKIQLRNLIIGFLSTSVLFSALFFSNMAVSSDIGLLKQKFIYTTVVPPAHMMTGSDVFQGLNSASEDPRYQLPKMLIQTEKFKPKVFINQKLNLDLLGPGANVVIVVSNDLKNFGFAISNGRFWTEETNGDIFEKNYPQENQKVGKYVWPLNHKGEFIPGNRIVVSNGPHGAIASLIGEVAKLDSDQELPEFYLGGHVGVDLNGNAYVGYFSGFNRKLIYKEKNEEEQRWVEKHDDRSLPPRFRSLLHQGIQRAFYGRNLIEVINNAPEDFASVKSQSIVSHFPPTRVLPSEQEIVQTHTKMLLTLFSTEDFYDYLDHMEIEAFLSLADEIIGQPSHSFPQVPQIHDYVKSRIFQLLDENNEVFLNKLISLANLKTRIPGVKFPSNFSALVEDYFWKNGGIENANKIKAFIVFLIRYDAEPEKYFDYIDQVLEQNDEKVIPVLIEKLFTKEVFAKQFQTQLKIIFQKADNNLRELIADEILTKEFASINFQNEIKEILLDPPDQMDIIKIVTLVPRDKSSARIFKDEITSLFYAGDVGTKKSIVARFLNLPWSKKIFPNEVSYIVNSDNNSLKIVFISQFTRKMSPMDQNVNFNLLMKDFAEDILLMLQQGSKEFLAEVVPGICSIRTSGRLPKVIDYLLDHEDSEIRKMAIDRLFHSPYVADQNLDYFPQAINTADVATLIHIEENVFGDLDLLESKFPEVLEVHQVLRQKIMGNSIKTCGKDVLRTEHR